MCSTVPDDSSDLKWQLEALVRAFPLVVGTKLAHPTAGHRRFYHHQSVSILSYCYHRLIAPPRPALLRVHLRECVTCAHNQLSQELALVVVAEQVA